MSNKDCVSSEKSGGLGAASAILPACLLSPIWWLWLPLGAMAVQLVLEISLPGEVLSVMLSESGPHEFLQFVLIFLALGAALLALARIDRSAQKGLAGWLVLAAVCCAYVAGEEISWGQHVFAWATPDFWENYNDQGETNLHNVSSWLDQKPRLLLEIGIITGGLVIPLAARFVPQKLPRRLAAFYPPRELAVVALLVVLPKLAEKTGEQFDILLFARVSEVQELYMFYFVLLYLANMARRARPVQR